VVTINGKGHYLGPWRSKASRVEYDRIISEWLANGRRSPAPQDDGPTVTDLIAAYWTYAEGYYVKNGRPSGVLAGIRIALGFLRDFYGDTRASEFSPLGLKALQMRMVEAGQCRPYVNNNIGHIKRMFKWAVAHEFVPVTVHVACLGRATARAVLVPFSSSQTRTSTTTPSESLKLQPTAACLPGMECSIHSSASC
jgi:hypothetical protein